MDDDGVLFLEIFKSWKQGIAIRQGDRFVFANRAFAELFGYDDAEDVTALASTTAVISQGDRDRVAHFTKARDSGERAPDLYELQAVRPDGSVWWAENRVQEISWHRTPAFMLSVVDITERKLSEQIRLNNEQRYRNLVEGSIQGIVVHRDSRILLANQAMADILGYEALADLYDLASIDDYVHPDDLAMTRNYRAARLAGGTPPIDYEFKALRRDGSTCWLDCRVVIIDWDGEPAFQGAFYDISERKNAELSLKKSESHLARAQQLAGLGNWMRDHRTDAVTWSAEVFRIFGIDPDQLVPRARDFFKIVHPDDLEAVQTSLATAIETGAPHSIDHRIVRADGTIRWVHEEGEVEYDDAGNAIRTFGTVQDITEQRLIEVALEASRTQLLDAIESISEGFILYDADERFVLCNNRFKEFYPGIADMLEPGVPLRDVAHRALGSGEIQYWTEDLDAWMARREDRSRPLVGTHEQHLKDGRWLLCSEQRTRTGHTVGIRTDITQRKLSEERLRQTQKLEAVGQLTGGVAHDFNNLLAVIMGNTELLLEKLDTEDAALQVIFRAADRGAELVRRLLAFSRQHALEPKSVNIAGVVSEMGDILRRTLGETIDIDVISDPGLWRARADVAQLESAILNLALNARHAMPDGGTLQIISGNATLDESYTATRPEVVPGDYVTVTVSDTGTGMTPEVQSHALEPFYTTKDIGEGTGLGLSMVYGFAKQSDGELEITSEVGLGTTVALYLPRAEMSDDDDQVEHPTALPRGRGETILVVEDESDVRELVEAELESLGYQVLVAENGTLGLDILATRAEIDLLLSDVVLPGGIDGPDLAEQAKSLHPGLRTLLMSGYAEGAAQSQGPLPRDIALLRKPFRRQDLAVRVREALDY